MPDSPHSTLTTVAPGVRQYQTILHWDATFGPAHGLVRIHLPAPPARPIVVVSQIRSNPGLRGPTADFARVADALLAALPPDVVVAPAEVIWFAHFGEFSSYDALHAPEQFVRINLTWDGAHYHGDLSGHAFVAPADAAEQLRAMDLAPVPAALRTLGWPY